VSSSRGSNASTVFNFRDPGPHFVVFELDDEYTLVKVQVRTTIRTLTCLIRTVAYPERDVPGP
jgi:hypothetical protein